MAWTIFRGFNHVGIFTGESQAAPAVVCTCSINKKKPWDAGQMIPTNTSTKITAVAGCSQQKQQHTIFPTKHRLGTFFVLIFTWGGYVLWFFLGGVGGGQSHMISINLTWSPSLWLKANLSWTISGSAECTGLGRFFWEIITVGGVGARGGYTLAIL